MVSGLFFNLFNLAYLKLFVVLFLFFSFFLLFIFLSFLGSWLKSENEIFGFFVFLIVLLLVSPLVLIVVVSFESSVVGSFLIKNTENLSTSYGFNFFERGGVLINEFPVFKGLWFELVGGVDQLAALFVFMVHAVAIMTISFSFLYFSGSVMPRRVVKDLEVFKLAVFSILLMSFFLDILFLTTNLVVMFVLAELTLLPLSFLMLKDNTVFWRAKFDRFSFFNRGVGKGGFFEHKFESKRPLAFYYLIFFTIVSGGLGLFGISLIYLLFGTTSLVVLSSLNLSAYFLDFMSVVWSVGDLVYLNNFAPDLITDYWLIVVALFLILFWISVKVPLAPVHIWLPKAHVEGSTESSMLLAGIILKITVYILVRLVSLPFFIPFFLEFKSFFLSVSVLTAVVGAFGALLTSDLKRIVAYSSVSHMGIIMSAGFFIVSSPISLLPFVVLLLTHTIVSTAMFMMVGCIYKSRYLAFISRNKLVYGGLLYIFPSFFFFGIIIFANLNIPLTMGFMGELGVLITIVQSGLTVGIFLCLAAFVLLLPMVSMLGQVLMGPVRAVDFFSTSGDFLAVDFFSLRTVFNKIVWSSEFLKFYYSQYLYFFSTFFIVFIFGIFPFLFADYLEFFSLNQAVWFDFVLDKITSLTAVERNIYFRV